MVAVSYDVRLRGIALHVAWGKDIAQVTSGWSVGLGRIYGWVWGSVGWMGWVGSSLVMIGLVGWVGLV